MRTASDDDVWRYAVEHDAVLMTKDQDFTVPRVLVASAPVVVWIRVGNTSRRALLSRFEPLIGQIVASIDAGERLIELR